MDRLSFAKLGMDSGAYPSRAGHRSRPGSTGSIYPKDYFIERAGVHYAGTHLIVDLWGARRLDDIEHIDAVLREAVEAAGATLLHLHLHHFTPNNGVSGVAVLAESHIAIHTWPERSFAALDVFMCGAAQPHAVIPVLEQAFAPESTHVEEHLRGRTG